MTEEDGLEITLGELHAGHLGQVLELASEPGSALLRAPLIGVRHGFCWPNDPVARLHDQETELTLLWATDFDETKSERITITADSQSRAVLHPERFR